ncbi:MAG TPA: hypothetical protein VGE74_10290 [Gemmata sp.]
MDQPSLEPVVQRLTAWRAEVVERLRSGDQSALALKRALDAALRWLAIAERCPLPAGGEAVALPAPGDFAPLGEYRVVWDVETEDRRCWREVARAAPGDVLVRLGRDEQAEPGAAPDPAP